METNTQTRKRCYESKLQGIEKMTNYNFKIMQTGLSASWKRNAVLSKPETHGKGN